MNYVTVLCNNTSFIPSVFSYYLHVRDHTCVFMHAKLLNPSSGVLVEEVFSSWMELSKHLKVLKLSKYVFFCSQRWFLSFILPGTPEPFCRQRWKIGGEKTDEEGKRKKR